VFFFFFFLLHRVAQPVFLGRFIMYFSGMPGFPKERAYLNAGGVSLCSGLALLLVHPYAIGTMHIGMQMRVAVCSLIYRKVNQIIVCC
jgi:ATP-binding cassette subfamily C (CFTR/MRP) protein 4